MLYIFGLKDSVLGQQFFQHGKVSLCRSSCGLRILKQTINSQWNIFSFHVYYLKYVIVLHYFVLYRLMLQVSSMKSSFWIACTAPFMVYLALCIVSISWTRHSYWSWILRSWLAEPVVCKLSFTWVTKTQDLSKLEKNCFLILTSLKASWWMILELCKRSYHSSLSKPFVPQTSC